MHDVKVIDLKTNKFIEIEDLTDTGLRLAITDCKRLLEDLENRLSEVV